MPTSSARPWTNVRRRVAPVVAFRPRRIDAKSLLLVHSNPSNEIAPTCPRSSVTDWMPSDSRSADPGARKVITSSACAVSVSASMKKEANTTTTASSGNNEISV